MGSQPVHPRIDRAKRERLKIFQGLSPESQGQNLVVTVLYVPYSLVIGLITWRAMSILWRWFAGRVRYCVPTHLTFRFKDKASVGWIGRQLARRIGVRLVG